jgi:YidC/Oxa1 family membrane protein insertase
LDIKYDRNGKVIMELLNSIIGRPLGALMNFCYELAGSWAGAILIFTILTKVIIFPLSLVAQKNSIKMVKMQPILAEIKEQNRGNGTLIVEEQRALYKKEKYSTIKGMLPLLIQIPIILGLIDVIKKITKIHSSFLGLDLSQAPTFTNITIIVPIISGLSALALCMVQNRYNVLQAEQGFLGKWGMSLFLVLFSGYFALAFPSGLGLYWTAGNLLSIPVLALCNLIYSPKKFIDYENRSVKLKLTREERCEKRQLVKELRKRERADEKRFFAAEDRYFVVYSENSGFYKYFAGIINHVIRNSEINIHYVTSDPNDQVFGFSEPRIKPYYMGDIALIGFMMKMDADVVLMTLPDIGKYQIKRSLVRKDVEYIYTDHGMTSFHLMLREGALDHFDTIFCYGPNHIEEVRETERVYGLPQKTLVKTGYGLLDELLIKVKGVDPGTPPRMTNEQQSPSCYGTPAACAKYPMERGRLSQDPLPLPKILIAPSWQKDNILDYCLGDLVHGLCGPDLNVQKYQVIIRPHPEYVKRFPARMQRISDKYGGREAHGIHIDTDYSSSETVYTSDIVITDWSSVAQEFSYATKKPSIFVNTPMKVMNPNYKNIPCVPLDISLRDEIGVSVDVEKLVGISEIVDELVSHKQDYQTKIESILQKNIYDIGHGSESSGDYIIGRIKNKIWERQY